MLSGILLKNLTLLIKLNNPSIFSKIADEFDFNTMFACLNFSMKVVVRIL